VIGAKMYEPSLMTPIDSADNTAGRAINVGTSSEIVFSPRGEHAYLIGRPPGTSEAEAEGTLLTPFNSATDALGRAILVPGDENSIVFAPDGETAYILTTGSSSDTLEVTYLDTVTNTIGRSVTVPGDNDELAITPNGETLYLTDPGGGTIHTPGWVIPIATGTGTVGRLIPAGDNPSLIAITPNGKTAYVLNTYSSSVTPITVATNTAGPPIPVCGPQDVVMDIAMAPDGGTVYVGCSGSAYIYSGDVTAISTATNAAEQTIPIDSDLVSISIAPDGGTLYVVGNGTSASSPGDVIGIETATNTPELPITVGWDPGGLVFAPDGRTAYVVSSSAENQPSVSLVTPIDVAANTAGHPIAVKGNAGAITART
jgi:DNA-binding beta-propeller fold protein YncE